MAGITEPSNKILIAGNPIVIEYKDGSSGAILPGDLVYLSGTNTIDEGGEDEGSQSMGIGFAGYEQASDHYKPDDETTAYADGDMIPVLIGPCILRARVDGATTTTQAGDALTGSGAGTGELLSGTIGTDHIYAIALEAETTATLSPVIVL